MKQTLKSYGSSYATLVPYKPQPCQCLSSPSLSGTGSGIQVGILVQQVIQVGAQQQVQLAIILLILLCVRQEPAYPLLWALCTMGLAVELLLLFCCCHCIAVIATAIIITVII